MSIIKDFEQKHFRGEYIGYHERDVDALLAHARALEAMLKKHEWNGHTQIDMCPQCSGFKGMGHSPDCALAKLLEGTNQ